MRGERGFYLDELCSLLVKLLHLDPACLANHSSRNRLDLDRLALNSERLFPGAVAHLDFNLDDRASDVDHFP